MHQPVLLNGEQQKMAAAVHSLQLATAPYPTRGNLMAVGFVLNDLNYAAAEGASEGIEMLRDNKLPVELEEFEVDA